ncbi:filamentous hemagglutinin N-terminal domain-containing protein [Stenotrophomonas sp. MYb238]|uniref:GLUG motif-containing protein n=1 Tax=Stenotrophomonas sp. MYb238 TaxID=2040281 RepID=UPI00129119A0|nr:GLUG motif-containing protein [Stenotrophomonas sp. MYb238]MQP74506.1 filamentous hemagglutinin N-terminal domain-containing protein [Stenotrophomonas sp. MYb238]
MNHIYRTVFNRALGVWQVVAEIASAQGKGRSAGHGGRHALHLLALLPLSVWASLASAASPSATSAADGLRGGATVQAPRVPATTLPSGGTVSAGSGSITQGGAAMTIAQQSQNLAINWQSFDIGRDASVTFLQPNSSAIALNRVLGTEGSQILGQLKGNGQVWVINPNGVLFGSTAQVSVGGLVASTLGLSDTDFMDGKRTFAGSGGRVVNQGRIDAGHVALLGETVRNEGVIAARLGTAALAAGNTVTLDFAGDQLLNVQVDEGALHALADNRGLIQADGGTVLMTARAKDALLDTAVNNSGVIRARTVENRNGRILLLGDMDSGTASIAGTLDASAPDGGNGGFIETSAASVNIAETAVITTKATDGQSGTWLIDPNDFTVAASGGNMTGAAVSNALNNNGNFIIQTATMGTTGGNGDIHVNDAINWSSNSTLTLDAERSININAAVTATGSNAGLAVLFNQGAGISDGHFYVNGTVNLPLTGSLSVNGQSYVLIDSLAGLTDLGNHYALVGDIDTPVTAALGNLGGTLEGLGHRIGNINLSGVADDLGLFNAINTGAQVRNLKLAGSVTGSGTYTMGLLAGHNYGTVANVHASGTATAITNHTDIGGLVGVHGYSGLMFDSSADVTVTGAWGSYTGGLVGNANGGDIHRSHATGAVSGGESIGGLVGYVTNASIIDHSYATGTVTGGDFAVGGLIGRTNGNAHISHVYATGAVNGTGALNAGGLVGYYMDITLSDVWASGAVTGGTNHGGLIGRAANNLALTNARWNTETTGQSDAIGVQESWLTYTPTNVAGLTTAQMRDVANWGGFATGTPGGDGWVLLDGVLPMLASEWSTTIRTVHQLQLMALDPTAHYILANDIDASATNGQDVWLGSSFRPVGNIFDNFTGSLDGLYHRIDNLYINRSGANYVGLFGFIDGGTVRNLGLNNVNVTGFNYVGGLAGSATDSLINNVYVTGTVAGNGDVGGLVGLLTTTDNNKGISDAYSAAAVSGQVEVGGLVGLYQGLNGYITRTYATGVVTGSSDVGGLVGKMQGTASLDQSFYATTNAGGSTINSGGAFNTLGTGRTLAQLKQLSTFSGWGGALSGNGGENTAWRIYDGDTTPLLRGFLKQLTASATPDYDGSGAHLANIGSASLNGIPSGAHIFGTPAFVQGDTLTLTSTRAGEYTATSNATVSGLYSDQQGYDISFGASRTISTPGSAAGEVQLDNGAAWTNGTLVINTTGNVSANAAISGGAGSVFRMVNGAWVQNATTLPGFAVNDFQLAGGSFLRATGGDGSSATPWRLADVYGLQGMTGLLGNHFALAGDIDASGTANWNCDAAGTNCAGFVPVGTSGNAFTGSLNGNDHAIGDLTINRATQEYVGLFGYTLGASLRDIGLSNVAITGRGYTGGLVGWAQGTSINDSFVASGQVTARAYAGGLAGAIIHGSHIQGSYAGANVESTTSTGDGIVGGLVGVQSYTSSISNSYATGNVEANLGNWSGGSWAGGLVGLLVEGPISNSYATGSVSGNNALGGLVGEQLGGTVSNSYATGTVSGNNTLGGLIGHRQSGTDSGSFYATTDAGGSAINSGAAFNTLGVGKTLAELKQLSTFISAGWDISNVGGDGKVWRIYDGDITPLLRSFLKQLTVSATPDYDGSGSALANIGSTTLTGVPSGPHIHGTASITAGDTLTLGSTQAGQYIVTSNATVSGLYSDQQGYDIVFDSSRTISTPGSAAGEVRLDNGVAWTNGTLVIDTTGNVSANAAISGGAGSVFRMDNGAWVQNTATPPGFAVNDFQLAGGSFLRATGGDGSSATPWLLADVYGLQGMAGLLGNHFALAGDIDANGTANWNCDAGGANCAGFVPVGTNGNAFTGSFNGNDFAIEGLTINRGAQDYVGLFGYANGSLRNVTLSGGSTSGKDYVGALAGYTDAAGTVQDSHVSASVQGVDYVGGLVGFARAAVSNSHAQGNVTGSQHVGGLLGRLFMSSLGNSYATGNVNGTGNVGGLVGSANGSNIDNSYAVGNVEATGDNVGGLVGHNGSTDIRNSYASGNVSGNQRVGGLVGHNHQVAAPDASDITNSYASGLVTGNGDTGGLVGNNTFMHVGGAIHQSGTITASFWNLDTSGQTSSAGGGTGITTAQMQQLSTFTDAGWDISAVGGDGKVWRIYEGQTAPLLRSFMTAVTVTPGAISGGKTYDGQIASGMAGSYTTSTLVDARLIGGTLGYATDGADAGTYSVANGKLRLDGLHSGQQGYDISYGGTASLTINKAALVVTANNAGKSYDGIAWTGGNGVSYSGFVNGEDAAVLGGTLAWGGNSQGAVNAGTYVISANGLSSSNYAISYVDGALTIDPRTLAIVVNLTGTVRKTYDGTTDATLDASNFLVTGWVGSDGATIIATRGLYEDANAGTGKSVTVDLTLADYLANAGTNLANYVLPMQVSGNVGVIDRAALTVGTSDVTRIYDGTTSAAGKAIVLGGRLFGDDAISGGSFAFTDKNAGTGKTVTVGGVTVDDGNGGGNYDITYASNTNSAILQKTVTIGGGFDARDKLHDGSDRATIGRNALALQGAVAGDALTVDWQAAFADAAQGTDKTVTLRGTALAGGDSGNYLLDLAGAPTAVASILGMPFGAEGGRYAGATRSAQVDGTWGSGHTATVPAISIQQCGQNLPAPLVRDCRL